MHTTRVWAVLLCLALLSGCTPDVDRRDGLAGPAGSPAATGTATASPIATAAPASPTAAPRPTRTRTRPPAPLSEIRRTDWPDVTLHGLSFCREADDIVRFRDGTNGLDIPCRILPYGARPVYAEFLVEEPANRPITEDALVLVEFGNPTGARQQALVPVAISYDGSTRVTWPVIEGDEPNSTGSKVMTFLDYRIDKGKVIARVKRKDGRTETRRYRQAGMFGPWERF